MNKKTTQILIALLCFAGSGLVLYYGYFKPQGASKQMTAAEITRLQGIAPAGRIKVPAEDQDEPILPLNKLTEEQLKVLKNINGDSYISKYPKFDYSQDVGVQVKDLIPPLEEQKK
jgi:hypothetical protein